MRTRQHIQVVEDPESSDPQYVELYRRLGERSDLDDLSAVIQTTAARPRVLELGCAAGGTAVPLARHGFDVWGVDADAAMLALAGRARLRNLHLTQSRIELLELGPQFDAVLASSHLLNTADENTRRAFLSCIARHLAPEGVAILELVRPEWFRPEALLRGDGVELRCDAVDPRTRIWRGRVTYSFPDAEFQEHLTDQLLELSDIDAYLEAVGLRRSGEPVHTSPVDMMIVARHARMQS